MRNAILYIVILILSVLLMASLQECSRRGHNADVNLKALTDTTKHYHNKIGTITASRNTLQLNNKQLQEYVIKKDKELTALSKEFARVKSVVKADVVVRIDSVPVPYSVPAPCVFERSGAITDKFYSFGYTSNQNGFRIDSLKVPATFYTITGIKRSWFLGKETVTTDVTSDNPYVKIKTVQSAEVVVPVPIYKKWYVWLATGIAGGYLISK